MFKKKWLLIRARKEVQGTHVHSIVKKKRLKGEKLEESIQRYGLILVWRWWIKLWLICLRIFLIDYEFDWAILINLCKTDFATRESSIPSISFKL